MRILKILFLTLVVGSSFVGFARADEVGGGTPDATQGAAGRDQPSSQPQN